jgi:hypothetical protein
MDINLLRENLKEIKTDNIVRLLSDVVLQNIDKITDHDPLETYYQNDVVYKKDLTTGKHQLYVCRQDNVKGEINLAYWDVFTFRLQKSAIMLESEFVATVDGTTNCPINQALFDPTKDALTVFHSVRGRLESGIDWIFNVNRTTIDLQGFSLYAGEKLLYEVIK